MQLHKKGRRPLFSRLLPVFLSIFFLELNKKSLENLPGHSNVLFFLYRSSCLFVEAKSSLCLGNDKSCTLFHFNVQQFSK